MQHPLIGAHISIAGGLHLAVQRALSIGCTTMQIFTKSNRSWFDKPLDPEEIALFRAAVSASGLSNIMAHTSYLINIGSKESSTEINSVKALALELQRAEALDIPYLVLHPGSHTGAGIEPCIKKIAKNLDAVLANASGKTTILIETMAGQGSNVGSTFEELNEILTQASYQKFLAACFDTCHVFSAGYDLNSDHKYDEPFAHFDSVIGLKNLKAFHLNDSKTPLNSRKDRHEELGKGSINLSFFSRLMNDPRFAILPKVLETPSDPEMNLYKREIELLRGMIG